ncbi:hypothetical protein [Thalassomonas sp. RHCl1]|uniref:hypothetical protein n=1 Tax=Thalassomonas sp. RHCl1 TaxID=2995320 RepID=UPI00248ABA25|nr:hypothetical protein [Thalassomonas sp. RHCl1]
MKWIITLLITLLVGSNALWLYGAIEQGVTNSYRDQQMRELDETRKQLMAVLPEIAGNLNKQEVVAIVSKHTDLESYEKEGCTWAGWVGLKFNETGALQAVAPVWAYGNENPCLQNF